MNTNDPKKKPAVPEDEFELLAPTGKMATYDEDAERPASGSSGPVPPRPKAKADDSLKQLAWRGFEEPEEESEEPGMNFNKKIDTTDDGMDMTPMVDVTFLLLIFFMVTASFSIQRSIQQPPSQINEPSNNVVEDPEDETDFVEVIIDQNNNYYVTTREDGEVETPTESQMRAKIRNAVKDYGAQRLMITAHVDSTHEKVVKVWDAGFAANLTRIQMRTTEVEY
jgi:biopolymer transport protein ExbD